MQPPGSAFGPPVGTGRWWVRLSRSTDPGLVPPEPLDMPAPRTGPLPVVVVEGEKGETE